MLPILEITRDYPMAYFVVSVMSVYIAYYLCYVVKKPTLSGNSKFKTFLIDRCPKLTEMYWPTVWCYESKAMTILRALIQSTPDIPYQQEIISLKDGGQVALDWVENESTSHSQSTRPTCILLPGLTGSSAENYMCHWVAQVMQLGYRVVVFNNRGNGGADLITSRTYCASKTDDLDQVIEHVRSKYPEAPMMAAGVSLGGITLTNYVAQKGDACKLLGAMTVSSPWDVFEAAKSLESPMNTFLFNKRLCNNLKAKVRKNEQLFKDKFDLEKVYKSVTIRDFDDSFVAQQFGYPSYKEYYHDACIHEKVHKIKIPLLALNANDDMFSPEHAIPLAEAEKSEHVCIATTSRGGHIGFCEGILPLSQGLMDKIFAQYVDAIFQHGDELHKSTN